MAYKKIVKKNLHSDTDLQYLQIGETHSLAVSSSGKIYSWGWNNCSQLGVNQQDHVFFSEDIASKKNSESQIQNPICVKNPRIVISGDNHNFLLDNDNNIYFWGSNDKYQSGDKSYEKYEVPTIINLFLEKKPIKNMISKGNQTIFLLETGECFCIYENIGNITNPFKNKIAISSVCCSYHFIIFLGKSGLLYSSGTNNSEGELGHGDKIAKIEPTLIQQLAKEKIVNIECGYKHVICKTNSNKIFVWGWGKRGQLGLGSLNSEYSPTLLNLGNYCNNGKIAQIQASYTSTLIMFENRRILWWGTNSTLYKQKYPLEISFQEKVNFLF